MLKNTRPRNRSILVLGTIMAFLASVSVGFAQGEPAGDMKAQDTSATETAESAKAPAPAPAEGETPAMSDSMPKGETAQPATPAESKPAATAEPVDPKAPYKNVKFAEGEKPRVTMETSMGKIVLELWPDVAPKHCQSFVHLINEGFYDSLTFHRIIPGFVIQGGCPLGTGTGGPGYNVPAEFSNKPHEDGILSMARATEPNSAGSQFFICLGRLTSLDNKYTVFGKVVEGLEVVHEIAKVQTAAGDRPVKPVYMTKVTMAGAKSE